MILPSHSSPPSLWSEAFNSFVVSYLPTSFLHKPYNNKVQPHTVTESIHKDVQDLKGRNGYLQGRHLDNRFVMKVDVNKKINKGYNEKSSNVLSYRIKKKKNPFSTNQNLGTTCGQCKNHIYHNTVRAGMFLPIESRITALGSIFIRNIGCSELLSFPSGEYRDT